MALTETLQPFRPPRRRGRTPALALAAALALALAGCGPRGALTFHPEAAAIGAVQPIFVVTARVADGGPNAFNAARSETPSFARFDVSVPPRRAPGTVTFPRSAPPAPETDFLTVSARNLGGEANFLATINAQLARLPRANREVFVFMHGFNTNFSEGLYRHAQMRHDFATPGLSVHYSWPSAGSVQAYAFDRESAIFARDGLQRTLELLARSDADSIVVAAHSMGAMTLMETLRSLALAGSKQVFDKLQAIVLIAPDLDVDLFRAQARPLAGGKAPIYLFFSSRDRALRASALLRGGGDRLGSIRQLDRIADLAVTLIDTSGVEDGEDALGHFAVATSPAMIAVIRGMNAYGDEVIADSAIAPNPVEATLNAVQNVGEAVLTPIAPVAAP